MRNKFIILCLVALCLAGFQTVQGQANITKLSRVKVIFVAPVDESVKREDFSVILKSELQRVVFGVTDDRKEADAILELKSFEILITLHGDRDDVPKLFYGFELISQTGAVIWNKTAQFLEKAAAENDQTASQKIAVELYYDRQKAVKKKGK